MKWQRRRPPLVGLAFSTSYGAAIYSLQECFLSSFLAQIPWIFRMIKFLEYVFHVVCFIFKGGRGHMCGGKASIQTWNPFLASSGKLTFPNELSRLTFRNSVWSSSQKTQVWLEGELASTVSLFPQNKELAACSRSELGSTVGSGALVPVSWGPCGLPLRLPCLVGLPQEQSVFLPPVFLGLPQEHSVFLPRCPGFSSSCL